MILFSNLRIMGSQVTGGKRRSGPRPPAIIHIPNPSIYGRVTGVILRVGSFIHFFAPLPFNWAPVVQLRTCEKSRTSGGRLGTHVDSHWQTTRFTGVLAKQGMLRGRRSFSALVLLTCFLVSLTKIWRNCYL